MTARLRRFGCVVTVAVDRLTRSASPPLTGRSDVASEFSLLYVDIEGLRAHPLDEALDRFGVRPQLPCGADAEGSLFTRGRVGGTAVLYRAAPHGKDYARTEWCARARPITRLVRGLTRAVASTLREPLGVREDAIARHESPRVENFAAERHNPCRVGRVLSEYRRGGASFRFPSSGQGVLALLANTVSARRQPEAALEALGQVAARARVVKGARGEAHETARSILAMLDAR